MHGGWFAIKSTLPRRSRFLTHDWLWLILVANSCPIRSIPMPVFMYSAHDTSRTRAKASHSRPLPDHATAQCAHRPIAIPVYIRQAIAPSTENYCQQLQHRHDPLCALAQTRFSKSQPSPEYNLSEQFFRRLRHPSSRHSRHLGRDASRSSCRGNHPSPICRPCQSPTTRLGGGAFIAVFATDSIDSRTLRR
ncbi:hypothetical protein BCR44DRAFT_381072 [Catenaria anguillulae PL171]|uniref:Uncharacterized protein n=1 Tax=Catenaria anguillulae PL171 TaxID=765915 RepID=A0A1Y2I3T8_9FUNG|nr:hypothetical protein BCR44DRAFT_381072 [Catenaria anguillulae PL171]